MGADTTTQDDTIRPTHVTRQRAGIRTLVYAGVAVLLLAAAAITGQWWITRGDSPDLPENVVVVIPFSNETGDPELDQVGNILGWRISEALEATGVARPVPWQGVSSAWEASAGYSTEARPGQEDHGSAFARQWGAGTLVSGSVFSQSGRLRFEAEVAGSGGEDRIGAIDPVLVSPDSVDKGIDRVSQRVAAIVGVFLDPDWGGYAHLIPAMPSMAFAREYLRSLEAGARDDWGESLRVIQRALSRDSANVLGRLWLTTAHLNLGHYAAVDSILDDLEDAYGRMSASERFSWGWNRAIVDGDREGAYEAARECNETTGAPVAAFTQGVEALRLNRVREAAQVLSDLATEYPRIPALDAGYWSFLCSALHLVEDHNRELEEAKQGRALHPDDARVLRAEIRARAALGDGDQVQALVEEAFVKDAQPLTALSAAAQELRVHGFSEAFEDLRRRGIERLQPRLDGDESGEANRPSLSLVGALYALEEWDLARGVAEALAQRAPSNVAVLGYLGALAARRGDREAALRYAEQLAALDPPYDFGEDTYRRARIAALLGEKEDAVQLLRQAHEEGVSFGVELHSDPDLLPLNGYPPYEEFMRPKG